MAEETRLRKAGRTAARIGKKVAKAAVAGWLIHGVAKGLYKAGEINGSKSLHAEYQNYFITQFRDRLSEDQMNHMNDILSVVKARHDVRHNIVFT